MKKEIAFVFAALMVMSAAARAAEVNFDGAKSGGLDTFLDVAGIVADLAGDRPQPGHPGSHPPPPQHPGHPGGHQPPPPPPPQPWNPGHTQPNHPGGHPPPPPYNPGWDHNPPPPPQYHFGGYRDSCRTMEFNAQSPFSQTLDLLLEEYGEECQAPYYGGYQHCRPSSNYHKRKVTVNIGPRQLEAWETERLEVCMKGPKYVTVNTAGMLYDYAVTERNDDGLFRRATIFTLTPGAKKPAQPDAKELSVSFAGVTAAGDVRLVLKDNRADYFRGEKITITADGMNIPEINQGMPVDQVLNSFVKFNVTKAFDTAAAYELKLLDAPKPGKYVVTLKFFRSGPLSSGAEASTMETFEIR
ncbi:MAG: hypothetical protein PHV33_06720 [Elusimicrobiales bacterium]|nr:hypothetical protein [Elusimicrobiales bacterium]